MNIHYLQHVAFEDLGCIQTWAERAGHTVSCTRLYAGETLPSLPGIDWLIVMGGPMGVYDDVRYPWLAHEKQYISQAIEQGKTVLGICLGAQLIAGVLGARVYTNPQKEIGWFPVTKAAGSAQAVLSSELPDSITAFHWHGDTFELPPGAVHLFESEACRNQAFVYAGRVAGFQFHCEITRAGVERLITYCGSEIIEEPFIQTAEEMLSDEGRFASVNRIMEQVLDRLVSGDTG